MKDTSEKILETALSLFNTLGLSKVTLRTIALEMGISQGNLNYHYKKRDNIIEKLYLKLVEEMDRSISEIIYSSEGLHVLFNVSKAIMNTLYKYRFFLFDFTQIIRDNTTIKEHYQELIKIRENQITAIFKAFVTKGIMREEQLKNEYLYLYKRIQIIGDFWLPSAKIEKSKISKDSIHEYLEIINQTIYPYLTQKGIAQYQLLHST